MKKLGRKALALSLCIAMGVSCLTGCGSSKAKTGSGVTSGLDKDTKGEVSIMCWSGDSKYYEDLGNQNFSEKDITSQNVAQIYAVAKKFNESYPNIKINLWAKTGDHDQPNTPSWDEEMENFKTDHGKYPDIWASTNVTNDIQKGLVADLSVYKDDETYKSYNESLMSNLNYYGFQGGLPQYTIPWGVWINKELAKKNNIDVPNPDWDIDEYTEFITSADNKTFWGDKGTPVDIINMGVNTINKQISEKGSVDLNNEEVKSLLKYVPKWAATTVDVAEGAQTISAEIMAENGHYEWTFFCNNRLLTEIETPWFLTAAADEKDAAHVNSNDWDVYPFPSTDYCKNTVRMVMDPICIHNYAADDDKTTEWSKEEEQKRLVSYTFATYWTASTEAKQAIIDQKWSSSGNIKSAAGDSFPVVTGDAYDEQMDIWNSLPAHKVYKDKEGFQEVVKIWKEGKLWDISDNAWTKTVKEKSGNTQECLYEWNHKWEEAIAGSWMTDTNWVDNVKSRLANWNESCNKRITQARKDLKAALVKYYAYKEADLKD